MDLDNKTVSDELDQFFIRAKLVGKGRVINHQRHAVTLNTDGVVGVAVHHIEMVHQANHGFVRVRRALKLGNDIVARA